MCLVTTWKEPLIATRDIECYKVIEHVPHQGDWHTPFTYMRVALGGCYTIENFPVVTTEEQCVELGFHSFFFREDARQEAFRLLQLFPHLRYAFTKCKIPAGSKYWEGKFGSYSCYCSDTIIYCTDDFVKIK